MKDDDTDRGRIFRLAARHTPSAAAPILKSLEQRWWALSEGTALPRRRNVTAGMIGDALPHAFIAERVAAGHVRLRVAGRRLSDLVGTEARGMPLSCLIEPESRAVLSARLELVFARPALVDLPVFAPRSLGQPALSGRLLLLPLEGDDGEVDRALGALLIDGATGRRPRRLRIDPAAQWRCDSVTRMLSAELHAINAPAPQIQRRKDGRPALRLVVNNDA